MRISSVPAVYGDNYTVGDIGFQFTDNSFISKGIVFITGWEAMSKVKVSHAFIVTGPNSCVEALMNKGTVQEPLTPRFMDPHVHVTIRRPVDLDIQRGLIIKAAADKLVGTPYDKRLIGGMLAVNSRLVRWWPTGVYMSYRRKVCQFFHTIGSLICSGGAVKSLNAVPNYAQVLAEKYYVYDPQMLFENTLVFKNWKMQYAR